MILGESQPWGPLGMAEIVDKTLDVSGFHFLELKLFPFLIYNFLCRSLLCILTREWELHMPFAGQNHLFHHLDKFFHLFPSQTKIEEKEQKITSQIFPSIFTLIALN